MDYATTKLYVRPSVRLSVKRLDYDKKEESSVQIFMPYETPFRLVLWKEEWRVPACTPSQVRQVQNLDLYFVTLKKWVWNIIK